MPRPKSAGERRVHEAETAADKAARRQQRRRDGPARQKGQQEPTDQEWEVPGYIAPVVLLALIVSCAAVIYIAAEHPEWWPRRGSSRRKYDTSEQDYDDL
jgi:hypothetical protein